MATSYDVRVWSIDVYRGTRTTSYIVRWRVMKQRFKERFKTRALADSFRSELLTAARKGEAFDVDTGRPTSMTQAARDVSWHDFACAYLDMKWPTAAATYRRSISEALTVITPALLAIADANRTTPGPTCPASLGVQHPSTSVIRRARPTCRSAAVDTGALRPRRRSLTSPRSYGGCSTPSAARRRPTGGGQRREQTTSSAVQRRRVRRRTGPPTRGTRCRSQVETPSRRHSVNRRTVVNPTQARTLLSPRCGRPSAAAHAWWPSSRLMYFAALRPEEAANCASTTSRCPPRDGANCIWTRPRRTRARTGPTTVGNASDGQLKNRARGEGRTVPCPPELTALLHEHICRLRHRP